MLASAITHRVVVTAEDGMQHGGAGSAIESALAEMARESGGTGPSVVKVGLPDAYLPHGRADAMLSELGLDGPGLAATVLTTLTAIGAHQVMGKA
jgi:1-deoxy-D-xylulose-5-phosphate synthase